MIIHKDSHTDHTITQVQWQHILAEFDGRTGFFIETIELPTSRGFVFNELYGPSCGDAPVPEAEVHYARRGDRRWDSRLIKAPKRPTRFVRVIAGPHAEKCGTCGGAGGPCVLCEGRGTIKFACVLYTAYGVSSPDMPAAPKEPGDLVELLKLDMDAVVQAQAMRREASADAVPLLDVKVNACIVQRNKTIRALRVAKAFWAEHALATEVP